MFDAVAQSQKPLKKRGVLRVAQGDAFREQQVCGQLLASYKLDALCYAIEAPLGVRATPLSPLDDTVR